MTSEKKREGITNICRPYVLHSDVIIATPQDQYLATAITFYSNGSRLVTDEVSQ